MASQSRIIDTGDLRLALHGKPAKAPADVKVLVLNGGAASGSAGTMSEALKTGGYTNQGPPTDGANSGRTGNSVFCVEGLKGEMTALKQAVKAAAPAAEVAEKIGMPDGEPASSEGYDCLVFVGA